MFVVHILSENLVYRCKVIIGSRNGFAPTWLQAISWTNDDKDIDANMRLSGYMC